MASWVHQSRIFQIKNVINILPYILTYISSGAIRMAFVWHSHKATHTLLRPGEMSKVFWTISGDHNYDWFANRLELLIERGWFLGYRIANSFQQHPNKFAEHTFSKEGSVCSCSLARKTLSVMLLGRALFSKQCLANSVWWTGIQHQLNSIE